MPERILFPEFRDEQEFSLYPFADTATLLTHDKTHKLDADIFLDASLYPIGGKERLFISQISITTSLVTLTISDITLQALATASFSLTDPPDNVEVYDAYGRSVGLLISEAARLRRFGAWSVGDHACDLGATEFAASCCIPTPEVGVRGVLDGEGVLYENDLWLIGDNGVVLRRVGEHTIRVDIVGDPLFARKLCTVVERFAAPRFIQTINNCPPDIYGNYNITVGGHQNDETVLRVYPTAAGLVIEAVGGTLK